jgi:hypothetical protein
VIVFPVPEIVPPVAVHVTPVLLVLLTVAVKVVVPLGKREALLGPMLTLTGAGGPDDPAVTVTDAEAFFVVSATLVAVTVYVPAVLGAVYNPEPDTVPPLAVQVTEVFEVPVTFAENCFVAPV